MKYISIPLIICFILIPFGANANYAKRADVQNFVDEMVKKHQFDREKLLKKFSKAKKLDNVLESIAKPAEKTLTWKQYRPIFIKEKRILLGKKFLREHKETLQKAEDQFGVPKEIIAAIVGVETYYGRYSGKYDVFDSLTTLGFDYPPRAAFFKRELEQLLLLAREEDVDIESVRGSYAGAMGMPQFISSSYRHYAIDFDKDGKRDLWGNTEDVIGSVANYFSKHGWRKGESVIHRVKLNHAIKDIGRRNLKPNKSIGDYHKLGVEFDPALPDETEVTLIELEGFDGIEHWAGLKNFYVITRYNHSALYALAVFQLSQELGKP